MIVCQGVTHGIFLDSGDLAKRGTAWSASAGAARSRESEALRDRAY